MVTSNPNQTEKSKRRSFLMKFKRRQEPAQSAEFKHGSVNGASSFNTQMQVPAISIGSAPTQNKSPHPGAQWGKIWTNSTNWLSKWRGKSNSNKHQVVFESLSELRKLYHTVLKETQQSYVYIHLDSMYRTADFLARIATAENLPRVAQLGAALATLLYNLYTTPKPIQQIPLRTVAQALDVLDKLALEAGFPVITENTIPPCILVVDDDATCAQVIATAVERTGLKAVNLNSPLIALEVVKTNRFQLVYLDISMPNMMGFEVCSRLRMLPGYEHVPIVFVTSHADFSTRTHASLSGGTDFVLKPFLLTELVVKTHCHINHSRLTNQVLEAGYPNAKAPMATGQPLF